LLRALRPLSLSFTDGNRCVANCNDGGGTESRRDRGNRGRGIAAGAGSASVFVFGLRHSAPAGSHRYVDSAPVLRGRGRIGGGAADIAGGPRFRTGTRRDPAADRLL